MLKYHSGELWAKWIKAENRQEWKQRDQVRCFHGHPGEIIALEVMMVVEMDIWSTLKLKLTVLADGLDPCGWGEGSINGESKRSEAFGKHESALAEPFSSVGSLGWLRLSVSCYKGGNTPKRRIFSKAIEAIPLACWYTVRCYALYCLNQGSIACKRTENEPLQLFIPTAPTSPSAFPWGQNFSMFRWP